VATSMSPVVDMRRLSSPDAFGSIGSAIAQFITL
jgi:hypothetical protein